MIRELVAAAAVLSLLAGCSPSGAAPAGGAPVRGSTDPVLAEDAVAPLVSGLVQRTPKELSAPRLAAGLVPPTNRWYSGLVFGEKPQPVFPLPLAFGLTADGFAFGLPKVTTSADTIAGGFAPDVGVSVGSASSVVTSDDPSVVVLENRDATNALLGRTTIAQGWPFVSWTAERATRVRLPDGFASVGDGLYQATLAGTRYALRATKTELDGTSADVAEGGSLVFWAVPDGQEPATLAGLTGVPAGSSLSYVLDGDQATTRLAYPGAQVLARLPQQVGGDRALGSYASIYGQLQLCAGDVIDWPTPVTKASAALDLSGITAEQRTELAAQLAKDADLPDFPADTYFGGKALQRAAMLLMIADQLGEKELGDRLARALDAQLSRWTEPQGCASREASCFVYDPKGRGVIGLTASFGSDEYNDHHFHYGYFLYAAAVLAAHDPSVVARFAPVLDLLAADIASSGSSYFPPRRTFDAYMGHSWASGASPFADGNNQESVSEAVNAYAGVSLWAQARGNQALADESGWMLSQEAAASKALWLAPDLSGQEFAGFGHGVVSLNWGGKRDYATWFSPASAAKLGILLLPMSPTSTYLAGDPERIRANVAEGVGTNFDQKFGDYIAAYSALAGRPERDHAVEVVRSLSAGSIDDGMSRTYLLAWLFCLRW